MNTKVKRWTYADVQVNLPDPGFLLVHGHDADRLEAAIAAKDAALDECIEALVEAAARIREAIAYSVAGTYHTVDLESRVGQCDAALEEARKAREL